MLYHISTAERKKLTQRQPIASLGGGPASESCPNWERGERWEWSTLDYSGCYSHPPSWRQETHREAADTQMHRKHQSEPKARWATGEHRHPSTQCCSDFHKVSLCNGWHGYVFPTFSTNPSMVPHKLSEVLSLKTLKSLKLLICIFYVAAMILQNEMWGRSPASHLLIASPSMQEKYFKSWAYQDIQSCLFYLDLSSASKHRWILTYTCGLSCPWCHRPSSLCLDPSR